MTTLRDAIAAMTRASRTNARVNDMKIGRLDLSVVVTAIATAVVLLTQFAVAVR